MRRCEHETIQSGRERLLLKPKTAPSNVSGPIGVRNSTGLFGREYALYVMVRRDNHCRFGDRGGSETRTSPRPTSTAVMPRLDRGIQYAAAPLVSRTGAEYWIARPSARVRTRRAMTPSAGRETGVPAAPKP